MENLAQVPNFEPKESTLLCAPLCNGAVCIPRTRYDALIRAEMEREILFHAYQQMNSFSMELVMDAIFNPDFKYKAKESSADAE